MDRFGTVFGSFAFLGLLAMGMVPQPKQPESQNNGEIVQLMQRVNGTIGDLSAKFDKLDFEAADPDVGQYIRDQSSWTEVKSNGSTGGLPAASYGSTGGGVGVSYQSYGNGSTGGYSTSYSRPIQRFQRPVIRPFQRLRSVGNCPGGVCSF